MGLTAGPDLHLCVCVVATKTLACQALRATCTPVGLMRWSRPPIGLDGKRRNGLGTVQVRETIQRSPSQAPTPTLLADDGVGRASLSPWRSTSDSPHRGVVQAGGCGPKAGTTGNERRPRESNADPCPFLKCGLTCAFDKHPLLWYERGKTSKLAMGVRFSSPAPLGVGVLDRPNAAAPGPSPTVHKTQSVGTEGLSIPPPAASWWILLTCGLKSPTSELTPRCPLRRVHVGHRQCRGSARTRSEPPLHVPADLDAASVRLRSSDRRRR
ncbi:hypothetical protein BH24ACT15_BH24ACT15_27070 [soil metagenome]